MLFDTQKDTIIETVSSVMINPDGKNKAIILKNIGSTVIYDKSGNVLQVIDGGYLDIGINDTMKDLIVNFIGALVFCFFGYFTLTHEKISSFIDNFVPTRGKRKLADSVIAKLKNSQ